MSKRRVSAKQRLELIREAVQVLNDDRTGSDTAFAEFVHNVVSALNDPLEPRPRQDDDQAPF